MPKRIVGNVVGVPGGGASIDETNLVHKTGDEIIKGNKVFHDDVSMSGKLIVFGGLDLTDHELFFDNFYISGGGAGIEMNVDGGEVLVNGSVIADNVYVGGKDVATKDDITSAILDSWEVEV